ncbi:GNAT family N-acetyltransferase [uncultured Methylibium sp.]|uniref:GNAT family N-acetyltransferase n=1 Tax=uncultured Methylibium sp. TaxID=381093 RepID=UPI0025E80D65|nr:GNAT family N-acetyltransferase [uncultured Methylibium sp.]
MAETPAVFVRARRLAPARPATIRKLGPADLGAYKSLRDEALRLHPEAFTSDHQTQRTRTPESYLGRLGLNEPLGGSFLLGAFVDGPQVPQLIGSVGLERETKLKRHTATLIGLMVLPAHTGHGIGRALVAACIAEARRAQGLETILLSVTASSARVVQLYEQAGFTRYGLLPRALRIADARGERYVDKAQMLLNL